MPRNGGAGLRLGVVATIFAAGFGLGFLYHRIASMAHTDSDPHQASMIPHGSVSDHINSIEARLVALEATSFSRGVLKGSRTDKSPSLEALHRSLKGSITSGITQVKQETKQPGPSHQPDPAAHTRDRDSAAHLDDAPVGGACPSGRKPYHILLTAQDNTYQAWQTQIMYYHFKKLQKANPCTEMTGFTRILSSDSGKHDALSSEIPTVAVKQLSRGNACHQTDENVCDMGFPVMNRPHAITQLLAQLPETVVEDYVMIMETDHIMLRELKNVATERSPICYAFG